MASNLSKQDIDFYHTHGYLVVPDILSEHDVIEVRAVIDDMVEKSRNYSANTDVYDLEDSHTVDDPRVRRIKNPHLHHNAFHRLVANEKVVSILQQLWNTGVRFDVSKLNMKSAGYGAPVEWHQDWAFYPHTNDDLAAVGYMLDDMSVENGAMMVLPKSHVGPVYDHHANGYFCGAVNTHREKINLDDAVPLTGSAGSITIHHVRMLHGSAPNTSTKPRRFLLHQYCATDAWPLLLTTTDYKDYTGNVLCGEPAERPRMANIPVKLPFPEAKNAGSIYENQRELEGRFFSQPQA